MSGLAHVCARARPSLAALGELGQPLLAVLTTVERVAGSRGPDVLADPGFALEVLGAEGAGEAAVVGRVLDFLRAEGGAAGVAPTPMITVAEAVRLMIQRPGPHGARHRPHLPDPDPPHLLGHWRTRPVNVLERALQDG